MTNTTRDNITRKTNIHHLLRRIRAGVAAIWEAPIKGLLPAAFLLAMALIWTLRRVIFDLDSLDYFGDVIDSLVRLALVICTALGLPIIIILLGTPRGSKTVCENLQKVGLCNHAGEAPILITKTRDKDTPRLTVWDFDPCGIPLMEWEDKQDKIEAALNITIAKMSWADGKRTIRVYAVPALSDFPDMLPWKDEYLSLDSFVLVLGEGLAGPVTVNLANTPHILLGGSTGSGKSVLLKNLLMQALHKGAEVYIADFKGGVDFPGVWHEECRMCVDERGLLDTLTELVEVLEYRKTLLAGSGCPNLDSYNKVMGEALPRLIFACDEVAEVLDKTGRSKEDKELLGQIESKLSTTARQGRAFGIHLILATQRPDATIIPGQIRNNMDVRICGRADNILSQIILDNTSAADQIPKDARGRFITGDGTVFQGFWFEDTML